MSMLKSVRSLFGGLYWLKTNTLALSISMSNVIMYIRLFDFTNVSLNGNEFSVIGLLPYVLRRWNVCPDYHTLKIHDGQWVMFSLQTNFVKDFADDTVICWVRRVFGQDFQPCLSVPWLIRTEIGDQQSYCVYPFLAAAPTLSESDRLHRIWSTPLSCNLWHHHKIKSRRIVLSSVLFSIPDLEKQSFEFACFRNCSFSVQSIQPTK